MAEKAWSDWYDGVLPSLPGLPTGSPADHFIKRAAIEFFGRSLAYRVAIPAFQATAATPTYTLAAPVAGTRIVEVLELRSQGKELTPRTPEWLKDHYGPGQDWRDVTADPPTEWVSEFPNQVRLVPFPVSTTANSLDGWAAVEPLETATGVDEALWREHYQPIANLAMAMAMEVPKKPYANPNRAQQLRNEVDSAIGIAVYVRARRGGRATFRTKTHWI